VIASSFDLPHERHVAAADMVLRSRPATSRARRDVVIVLDSLTAARALPQHHGAGQRSHDVGRSRRERARQTKRVVRSRARGADGRISHRDRDGTRRDREPDDDVIFEEFKGTGNASCGSRASWLTGGSTRPSTSRRAARVAKSCSRRQDDRGRNKSSGGLLFGLPPEQAMQSLLQQMKRAKTNAELLTSL